MGLLAEWKTFFTGTPTTLSRGSVKDACSMRYASGEKARRILGYEARVGIEEGLRLSCQVSHFRDPRRLQHMLMHITGLRTPITAARGAPPEGVFKELMKPQYRGYGRKGQVCSGL
jgi:hypothetical protein